MTLIPRSLVYCPDLAEIPEVAVTTSSTNGAATGSDFNEAAILGITELVERDAFWFYCRTDAKPFWVPPDFIPSAMVEDASLNEKGEFFFQLLKSPFNIHVVQAVFRRKHDLEGKSKTARGTGASYSLGKAVYRAFSECIQIISSLDTGESIDESDFDMRRAWYVGESTCLFPSFFTRSLSALPDGSYEDFKHPSLADLSSQAKAQDIRFYLYKLFEAENVCVVKALCNEINSLDSEFYCHSRRLERYSRLTGVKFNEIKYHKSTFM